MNKTVVWGCGQKLTELVDFFPDLIDRVYLLVDKFKTSFRGRDVSNPDILSNEKDITLVICVRAEKEREDIIKELSESYGISPDRIISETEWLIKELRSDQGLLLKPSRIRLEASTMCQLNCTTCSMRLTNHGNLGAGYLKFLDFKKLVDDNSFVKEIELANYGEVFLNPELKDIIKYAHEKGVSLTVGGGTNFNNVSDEVIDEMARTGAVKRITVAIDGASQETYSQYRRNGDFNKVIDNIRKLNEAKEKYQSEYPKLKWQYILFEHNEEEIPKAKYMAKELGMEMVFKLDWSGEFKPKDREKLEKETGLNVFNRVEYKNSVGKIYNNVICRQLIYQPAINYDGRLLGCCGVKFSDWGCNAFKDGLVSALNSKQYTEGVLALLENNVAVDSNTPCGQCSFVRKGDEMHIVI